MKLYRTASGCFVEEQDQFYTPSTYSGDSDRWDWLITRDDLYSHLQRGIQDRTWKRVGVTELENILAPIGSQEVWAAGVTYYRSREARIEESKQAAGGGF